MVGQHVQRSEGNHQSISIRIRPRVQILIYLFRKWRGLSTVRVRQSRLLGCASCLLKVYENLVHLADISISEFLELFMTS